MGRRFNNRFNRNRQKWRNIEGYLGSPRGVSMLVTFIFIWIITGFNFWVGFGLLMALMGSAGFFGKKARDNEYYNDYFEEEDDDDQDYLPEVPKVEKPTTQDYSQEIHQKVIEDARNDLLQIKAASAVASGAIGENLLKIVQKAEQIERDLIKEPFKLSHVQRVFTYYIPSTQDLLLARGKAQANNDSVKLNEIDNMLARLAQAFEDFAGKMHGEDARSIDIDIKLLEQSLAQDLHFDYSVKNKN